MPVANAFAIVHGPTRRWMRSEDDRPDLLWVDNKLEIETQFNLSTLATLTNGRLLLNGKLENKKRSIQVRPWTRDTDLSIEWSQQCQLR